MLASQIEVWALRVIEGVVNNLPSEDARVELKREWPDPQKAARQIAGHANAARGEDILWIIGVDENDGVIGVESNELSNWSSIVNAQFDGIAPSITPVNISVRNKIVVALLFDTSRMPFVVANPLYGSQNGGNISYEVPWREGNSTRSARHSDLIKLLVPLNHLPDFEILDGKLSLVTEPSERRSPTFRWNLNVSTYIIPRDQERLVLPTHRLQVKMVLSGLDEQFSFDKVGFKAPDWESDHPDYSVPPIPLITTNPSSAIVDGPGRLDIFASLQTSLINISTPNKATITIMLSPARASIAKRIDLTLSDKSITRGDIEYDLDNINVVWKFVKENNELV